MNHRVIKQKKIDEVKKLSDIVSKNGVAIFKNKGINGFEVNSLRQKLKESNLKILYTKNKLLQIAMKNNKMDLENLNFSMKEENLMVVGNDSISAIGSYSKFSKEEKQLLSPVCTFEKNVFINNPDDIKDLSNYESKNHFYGSFLKSLLAPAVQMVKILEIVAEKKQSE